MFVEHQVPKLVGCIKNAVLCGLGMVQEDERGFVYPERACIHAGRLLADSGEKTNAVLFEKTGYMTDRPDSNSPNLSQHTRCGFWICLVAEIRQIRLGKTESDLDPVEKLRCKSDIRYGSISILCAHLGETPKTNGSGIRKERVSAHEKFNRKFESI